MEKNVENKNVININDYKKKKFSENKNTFNEIITRIFYGLTGDNKKDIEYLKEQIENFREHEFAIEIARECGRKISEIMPSDMKNSIDKVFTDINDGITSMIEEVEFNIYKRNIDKAEKLLLPTLEKVKEFEKTNYGKDDKVTEYSEFREPFEEALYRMRFNPKKDLKARPTRYGEVYYYYGYLLIEKSDIEGAREALKKAVDYAPINAKYVNEYGETYKMEYNKTGNVKALEKFYENSKEIMRIAYKPDEIARCFRNFAYYFVEKKLYNEAVICHMLALPFTKDTTIMQSELFYIKEKCKDVNVEPTFEEVEKFCNDYGIPKKCDPDIQRLADEGVGFILSNDLDEDLKKYYSETIMPILSNEMLKNIKKTDFTMLIMNKNNESINHHKIYTLDDIEKIKTITEQKNIDIDSLDTVKFGKYEQDTIDKSDIEWIVLEKDGEKALLMSKYILDCKMYDGNKNVVSWKKSSLRKWLNNEFYNNAFEKNEQKQIIKSNLTNSADTIWERTEGRDTEDKIFCLSSAEIEKYYKDENINDNYYANKFLATRTTPYVIIKSNIFVSDECDKWYVGNSYFWTRSVSKKTTEISGIMPVNEDGTFAGAWFTDNDTIGVRPAMWVKIK